MALNFKQEVNLFLDLYLWSLEHILITWSYWDNKFYWNRQVVYNEFLINFTNTKEIIKVLEPVDITESIKNIFETDYSEYKLEDFETYAKVNKKDYVAIDNKWIELKLYKSICKMLDEFNNITVRVWEMITFYEWETPMIIIAPYKIDSQTELFDKE